MSESLIPIKVKVNQKSDGSYDYPKFENLTSRPSFNHMARGIKLDKIDGLNVEGKDSPIRMVWGLKLVSQEFYDEAVVAFSDRIIRLTNAEAESFWNEKAQINEQENIVNKDVLSGLETERNLLDAIKQSTTDIDLKITKALDSSDPEPGIVKNKNKIWVDAITANNIIIIDE